jgi:hypothetical protein
MKIKHWQGYGSVNAKVTSKTLNSYSEERTITIKVWGNHEYGLDRSDDRYDVFHWLLLKFDKEAKRIKSVKFQYLKDFEGQECGQYDIVYSRA